MRNILPVVTYAESITYQRVLGIISILVSLDSRINMSWTLESFYSEIARSVENKKYKIEYNSIGQPDRVYCWQDDINSSYIIAMPFSEKDDYEPAEHIELSSYDFYRYIGNAFELLCFSDYHKIIEIEYLQREILPPAWYKQLMVYYDDRDFPWAFFSWARVSSVIEERLKREKIGLEWVDWNCGERLYVNDLAAPWGGTRYVIRDMRERIFPLDKGAKGTRRKAALTLVRGSHFKAHRAELQFDDSLLKAINTFTNTPGTFKCYQNLIGLLDEFKGRYELAVLLDKNNVRAAYELDLANTLYYQTSLRLQLALKNVVSLRETRAADYLALGIQVKCPSFWDANRLGELELEIIRKITVQLDKERKLLDFNLINEDVNGLILNHKEVQYQFKQAFMHYLPQIVTTGNQLFDCIQIDLRTTCDKVDSPFAKQMGPRLPTYVSVPFNGSSLSCIDLVHELSHAILYTENRQHTDYLFIEDRPLVNEIFAFIGEYIYVAYLRLHEEPHVSRFEYAVKVKDNYYFDECLPLINKLLFEWQPGNYSEYSTVYPVARIIAKYLAQQIVNGQKDIVKLVINLCQQGSEFCLETLLLKVYQREDFHKCYEC
ncbi:toxin-activating lysine-acyltransferase [Photobacterium sanguinicancri]|uniref:toxin-activating lysine-acyltransferase n=1 Tax=Photobacterium sanguinicancri TaxID=875932 RepID=UPI0026E2726E|nr:toxin-activating lysine-acyltransferase [Photobacterium sanguinicancri]MDO6498215.1 toxin-activating lysine-acyltransferase [Photobacterium sanguinicancri]